MSKLIVFVLLTINFISCSRNCEKECKGVDKNSLEYKFSPVLEPKDVLVFKHEDSEEKLELKLDGFTSTGDYIEKKCSGFAYDANCKGYIQSSYNYNYKDTSSLFYSHISFYYDKKYKGGCDIGYQISFDKKPYKSADFYYKDNGFKLGAMCELDYSSELKEDTLTFTNNGKDYNANTIKKIWIKKNEGIVKFKLDDKIWIKQL